MAIRWLLRCFSVTAMLVVLSAGFADTVTSTAPASRTPEHSARLAERNVVMTKVATTGALQLVGTGDHARAPAPDTGLPKGSALETRLLSGNETIIVTSEDGIVRVPADAQASGDRTLAPVLAPSLAGTVDVGPGASVLDKALGLSGTEMSLDVEGAWLPSGWKTEDWSTTDGGEYLWSKRNCHPHGGSYAAWSHGGGTSGSRLSCGANYPDYVNSWLIYGPFSLVGANSATLTYHLYGRTEGGSSGQCRFDFLGVGSSVDDNSYPGTRYCGDWTSEADGNGYLRDELDLSDRLGESQVWVGFYVKSDGSNTYEGIQVDDIRLDITRGAPRPPEMAQDLESGWPGSGWTLLDNATNDRGEYLWGKRSCHPHTGAYAAWGHGGGVDGSRLSCGASYPNSMNTWALYGPFSLVGARSARATFYYYGVTEGATNGQCNYDFFFASSTIDRDTYSGGTACGRLTNGSEGNGYYRGEINLSSRLGQPTVWLGFLMHSDASDTFEGIHIDDIRLDVVREAVQPTVPVPTATWTPRPTATPTPTPTATPTPAGPWLSLGNPTTPLFLPPEHWLAAPIQFGNIPAPSDLMLTLEGSAVFRSTGSRLLTRRIDQRNGSATIEIVAPVGAKPPASFTLNGELASARTSRRGVVAFISRLPFAAQARAPR